MRLGTHANKRISAFISPYFEFGKNAILEAVLIAESTRVKTILTKTTTGTSLNILRHSELSVNQSNKPKVREQKRRKEKQEINEKNIWKQKMKIRKEFFYKNYPTLVIGPVNGHQLESQTSILKIFERKGKTLATLIKAYTYFSMTWKTVFVHFQKSTTQQLENLVNHFNEMQQRQWKNLKGYQW
ncbi:hypothetical protein RFI_05409 [Reticulomyxa filosa]|uniref:Uncharacterized protein n=1 Tax=Reticulomyxa filosa TaxID=46433 RepID=X6P0V1_RETFI|nr:hypothetical protein RFI_05409 [Reticulomyxa filosa]|eukprot:ETO31709.1 hypothetical protein RFI_05409 [Reticulomyxa filosa]